MKTVLFAFLLAAGMGVQAQDQVLPASGIIEYEVMTRVDMSEMRVVRIENGVRTAGMAASMAEHGMELPDMMGSRQVVTFTAGHAKLETEGGRGGGPMMFSTARRANAHAGAGAPPPVPRPAASPSMRPPLSNATYIDLERKKYISVLKEEKDSVVKQVWFSEDDFKPAAKLKQSSKTKTIAGYKCRRATAKMGEENFVIWYTTEIPVTFSPVNGILPEKGVVLSIESSRRSYVAKKVELKPVAEAAVSVPADAQKVSAEELKAKRRQIMERFHNEQLEKFEAERGR